MITRRGFFRFLGGSVLAAAALGSYAVGIEPMLLTRVKRYALTPPNWPDGLKLRVVALADIHACRPWMTPERIASLAEEANALEPDIFHDVPSRVALTLSGHTHGGQVRLFGYSPVVPSRYGNRYAYGHVVEAGRNLIISGGLGFSIAPIRFGVRPEILTIDLG